MDVNLKLRFWIGLLLLVLEQNMTTMAQDCTDPGTTTVINICDIKTETSSDMYIDTGGLSINQMPCQCSISTPTSGGFYKAVVTSSPSITTCGVTLKSEFATGGADPISVVIGCSPTNTDITSDDIEAGTSVIHHLIIDGSLNVSNSDFCIHLHWNSTAGEHLTVSCEPVPDTITTNEPVPSVTRPEVSGQINVQPSACAAGSLVARMCYDNVVTGSMVYLDSGMSEGLLGANGCACSYYIPQNSGLFEFSVVSAPTEDDCLSYIEYNDINEELGIVSCGDTGYIESFNITNSIENDYIVEDEGGVVNSSYCLQFQLTPLTGEKGQNVTLTCTGNMSAPTIPPEERSETPQGEMCAANIMSGTSITLTADDVRASTFGLPCICGLDMPDNGNLTVTVEVMAIGTCNEVLNILGENINDTVECNNDSFTYNLAKDSIQSISLDAITFGLNASETSFRVQLSLSGSAVGDEIMATCPKPPNVMTGEICAANTVSGSSITLTAGDLTSYASGLPCACGLEMPDTGMLTVDVEVMSTGSCNEMLNILGQNVNDTVECANGSFSYNLTQDSLQSIKVDSQNPALNASGSSFIVELSLSGSAGEDEIKVTCPKPTDFATGDMCAANTVSGSSITLTAGDLASSASDLPCACGLEMPDAGMLTVDVEIKSTGPCNEMLNILGQNVNDTVACVNDSFSYNLTRDSLQRIKVNSQNPALNASGSSFIVKLTLSGSAVEDEMTVTCPKPPDFASGEMCATNTISGSSITLTAGDLASSIPDQPCSCGLEMPNTGLLMVNVEATAIGGCNEVLSLFGQIETTTMICQNGTFNYNLTQDRLQTIQLALKNASLGTSDGSISVQLSLSGSTEGDQIKATCPQPPDVTRGEMCAANTVSGSSITLTAGDLASSAFDLPCACGLEMPDTGMLVVNVEVLSTGSCNEMLNILGQNVNDALPCMNGSFSYNLTRDSLQSIKVDPQNPALNASGSSFIVKLSLSGSAVGEKITVTCPKHQDLTTGNIVSGSSIMLTADDMSFPESDLPCICGLEMPGNGNLSVVVEATGIGICNEVLRLFGQKTNRILICENGTLNYDLETNNLQRIELALQNATLSTSGNSYIIQLTLSGSAADGQITTTCSKQPDATPTTHVTGATTVPAIVPSVTSVSDASATPVTGATTAPAIVPSVTLAINASVTPLTDVTTVPVTIPAVTPVSDASVTPVTDVTTVPVIIPPVTTITDPSLMPVTDATIVPVIIPSVTSVIDPSVITTSVPDVGTTTPLETAVLSGINNLIRPSACNERNNIVRMCYNNTVSSFDAIFLDAGEIPTSQTMPCTCNVTSSDVGTYSVYSVGITSIADKCGTRLIWNGSVPEAEQVKNCRNPNGELFYTTLTDPELNGVFILDQTDTSIAPDTKYCMELELVSKGRDNLLTVVCNGPEAAPTIVPVVVPPDVLPVGEGTKILPPASDLIPLIIGAVLAALLLLLIILLFICCCCGFCVRRDKSSAFGMSSTLVSGSSMMAGVAGASAMSSAGGSKQAGGLGMASDWSSTAYNMSSTAVAAPMTHEYTSFYSKGDIINGANSNSSAVANNAYDMGAGDVMTGMSSSSHVVEQSSTTASAQAGSSAFMNSSGQAAAISGMGDDLVITEEIITTHSSGEGGLTAGGGEMRNYSLALMSSDAAGGSGYNANRRSMTTTETTTTRSGHFAEGLDGGIDVVGGTGAGSFDLMADTVEIAKRSAGMTGSNAEDSIHSGYASSVNSIDIVNPHRTSISGIGSWHSTGLEDMTRQNHSGGGHSSSYSSTLYGHSLHQSDENSSLGSRDSGRSSSRFSRHGEGLTTHRPYIDRIAETSLEHRMNEETQPTLGSWGQDSTMANSNRGGSMVMEMHSSSSKSATKYN